MLVVDKPRGPTSHDVVGKVRRALRTRAVGHAGTLDPMATGVLVIAVGEATKLVRWLTADDKAYSATLALGAETDTLDAEGKIIEEAPVGDISLAAARAAAGPFVGTYGQFPPAFSAIRVDGERLHERARRGETVVVPERRVTVHRLEILEVAEQRIEFEVESAKGFYVRSLGRDLARALGTRGHLVALRRIRSGAFDLSNAVDAALLASAAEDEEARAELTSRLIGLTAACGAMPHVTLDERGVEDARHGRRILVADTPPQGVEPIALLDREGALVAVGRSEGDYLQVIRGFNVPERHASPNAGSRLSRED